MTSNKYLTSYQRIEGQDDVIEGDEDLPLDHVLHVVPKSDQTRWNHIEDLDNFFLRVYQYHQAKGFGCRIMREALDVIKYVFTVLFTTFLVIGINFDIMFGRKFPPGHDDHNKASLVDCIRSFSEMREHISSILVIYLVVAALFFIFRMFYFALDYFHFRDIKKFYNVALGVQDCELENYAWDDIQHRMMEVQVEQRMCIHKESLTELDIYHRILRYENYFIAMVNKNVIPLKMNIPMVGETVFLTRALRFNINCILFYFGAIAPFKNWHLKDEYKRAENRHRLAEHLNRVFSWAAFLNFLFFPFILLLQVLYAFYNYAGLIKREPGYLGTRTWSPYGEVSLRHYNELDHEIKARLNRGYRSAAQYMNIFISERAAIIASFISYICSAVLAVLLALTVFEEYVLQLDHSLTLITGLAAVTAACHVLIPNENQVYCPEVLMTKVLAEVHYLPDSWRDRAHTQQVRKEFSNYFQYKLVHLLESLVSPIVTPYMLFNMRSKSLEIVDFLRNFTVEVQGVGDICSFAQMDIRRHGSRTWHPRLSNIESGTNAEYSPTTLTDNGKTELSLLHFTLTNPNWKPPQDSVTFLHTIKKNARTDFKELAVVQEKSLIGSINSLSLGGLGNINMTQRWLSNQDSMSQENWRDPINRMDGSRVVPSNGILNSLTQGDPETDNVQSAFNPQRRPEREPLNFMHPIRPQDMVAMDMSVSALYLHDFHRRLRAAESYADSPLNLIPQNVNFPPQPPTRFGGLPPSNISESCYNSSDPPSVDESLNLASHALASISHIPFPQSPPLNTSFIGPHIPQSTQCQWNLENTPSPNSRT